MVYNVILLQRASIIHHSKTFEENVLFAVNKVTFSLSWLTSLEETASFGAE